MNKQAYIVTVDGEFDSVFEDKAACVAHKEELKGLGCYNVRWVQRDWDKQDAYIDSL